MTPKETKFVKLTLENETGKFKFFMTEYQLLSLFDQSDYLNALHIDAKNGMQYILADEIKEALKIVPSTP